MTTKIKATINEHAHPGVLPDISIPKPLSLVILGATGDLTRRKLLPALFVMYANKMLPTELRIVAFARRDYTDETFRDLMAPEIQAYCRIPVDEDLLASFISLIDYHKGNLDDNADFESLKVRFDDTDKYPVNKVYYLSTAPNFFGSTIAQLKCNGLISEYGSENWTRVVIEKPFGHDLKSATKLNTEVLRLLDESQVYRIDHYLGKETVQNILAFRFANAIFEPLFNNRYVDHIQVTAGETVGMESGRGAYYDESGALRDMFQNHLLQLLCLVTMEPPSKLNGDAVRNEKVKVLQSLTPIDPNDVGARVIRGQYGPGMLDDKEVPAYIQEDRVPADSKTETFLAAKFYMNNWRWAGVPMFLRTGKRLKKKYTSISIQFKKPPLEWFNTLKCEGDNCELVPSEPNVLTFRIAPDEGIKLEFLAKRPAMQMMVEGTQMDFNYDEQWHEDLPEAYERLLMDVMRGDSTLFTRSDEVEAAWGVVDPILNAKDDTDNFPVYTYKPGHWGPLISSRLFDHEGQDWIND